MNEKLEIALSSGLDCKLKIIGNIYDKNYGK
jgi:hypothetical protein